MSSGKNARAPHWTRHRWHSQARRSHESRSRPRRDSNPGSLLSGLAIDPWATKVRHQIMETRCVRSFDVQHTRIMLIIIHQTDTLAERPRRRPAKPMEPPPRGFESHRCRGVEGGDWVSSAKNTRPSHWTCHRCHSQARRSHESRSRGGIRTPVLCWQASLSTPGPQMFAIKSWKLGVSGV